MGLRVDDRGVWHTLVCVEQRLQQVSEWDLNLFHSPVCHFTHIPARDSSGVLAGAGTWIPKLPTQPLTNCYSGFGRRKCGFLCVTEASTMFRLILKQHFTWLCCGVRWKSCSYMLLNRRSNVEYCLKLWKMGTRMITEPRSGLSGSAYTSGGYGMNFWNIALSACFHQLIWSDSMRSIIFLREAPFYELDYWTAFDLISFEITVDWIGLCL